MASTAAGIPPVQRMLDVGEGKKLLQIAALMIAIAHVRRKEMQRRWLGGDGSGSEPVSSGGWQDHPAVPYVLENAMVWTVAYIAQQILPPADRTRPLLSFFMLCVKGVVTVDVLVISQKLLCAKMYKHVPYFSERKPPEDFKTIAADYARTNLPDTFVNAAMQLGILYALPDALYEKSRNPGPIRVLPLLAKFLFGRVVVDVSFGLVHYIMHANQTIYRYVHKRHHEHTAPRTQTNYHFEKLDLFLEAIAPIYIWLGVMHGIGYPPNLNEQAVIATTYLYYESASHSGKELPAVTWMPLLSPLIGWFTGSDDRLVEYHTRHHQLFNCNYSISPWPDKLCGTYRIDLPEAYSTSKPQVETGDE